MMTKPRRRPDHNEWRLWFAWHPVRAKTSLDDGDSFRWIWLQRVMRRCTNEPMARLICIDCGCSIVHWYPFL